MKKENFEELVASVAEGAEILNKNIVPSRTFSIDNNFVREIRLNNNLTQDKFAKLLGISVGTLKNLEQGRRKPTGPANVLLKLVAKKHELLKSVIL